MENDKDKKKDKSLLFIILISSLIISIGLVIGLNYNKIFGNSNSVSKEKIKQQIDENADEFFEKKDSNEPNIIMPGWKQIIIDADTTDISGIDFYNPESNKGYYYLKFQLKIKDEVLYESNLVEPGKHIQKIKISRPLKAGVYDAVVFIQPYKLDMETPTNSGEVKVKLIVK